MSLASRPNIDPRYILGDREQIDLGAIPSDSLLVQAYSIQLVCICASFGHPCRTDPHLQVAHQPPPKNEMLRKMFKNGHDTGFAALVDTGAFLRSTAGGSVNMH